MGMTSLRAEELLCDAIVRRGGDPWGYQVLREWRLDGSGHLQSVLLPRSLWEFATPLLATKRASAAAAAIDLLATDGGFSACLVSNSRELRDFLASGFPVASCRSLIVGYDDLRFLSTDGPALPEDLFSTKLIALASAPAWTTRL